MQSSPPLLPLRQIPRCRHELNNKAMSVASKLHLPVCSPKEPFLAASKGHKHPPAGGIHLPFLKTYSFSPVKGRLKQPTTWSRDAPAKGRQSPRKQPIRASHGADVPRTCHATLWETKCLCSSGELASLPCSKVVSSCYFARLGHIFPSSSCALCTAKTCREDCRNLGQREDFPDSALLCNGCCCWRGSKGLKQVCCNW